MRVDFAALGHALAAGASAPLVKAAAAVGVTLAATTLVYAVWPHTGEHAPADPVAVAAPVFKPWKPAVVIPATAAAPAPRDDEARPSVADPAVLARAIQRHLRRAGCYDGRIDGRWTAATRRAMSAFTEVVNARLPVDEADPVFLTLLETHQHAACGDAPARIETASIGNAALAGRADDGPPSRPDAMAEPRESATTESRDADPAADAPPAPEQVAVAVSEDRGDVVEERASAGETVRAAAAVAPRRATRPRRLRTTRKYRKSPSFSRSVSRSFRKIQRSFGGLF